MGRESRQARRAKERRAQQPRRRQATSQTSRWSIIGGAAVIVIAIAVLGALAFNQGAIGGATPTPTPPAEVVGQAIDNIGCFYNEQVTYHVHAHLDIYDAGKLVRAPAGMGINTDHDCLYWLHVHNPDGVIHIEAPHKIVPILGNFFDIWHKPLNSKQVGPVKVKPGQQVKVFVDEKPYSGDPRNIRLHAHTDVQIDVGPPFPKPHKYQYNGL